MTSRNPRTEVAPEKERVCMHIKLLRTMAKMMMMLMMLMMTMGWGNVWRIGLTSSSHHSGCKEKQTEQMFLLLRILTHRIGITRPMHSIGNVPWWHQGSISISLLFSSPKWHGIITHHHCCIILHHHILLQDIVSAQVAQGRIHYDYPWATTHSCLSPPTIQCNNHSCTG